MRSVFASWLRPLVFAIALPLPLAACSRELLEQDVFAQPDLSGSVRIPLATTRADGTTYLLRDATVEIGGSALLTLSSASPDAPSAPNRAARAARTGRLPARGEALTTPLPAGSYTLYLRPGFRLIEVDQSGAERALEATLSMQNPLHFTVREFEDATLKLSFKEAGLPDSDKIVFGAPQAVRVTAVLGSPSRERARPSPF